MSHEHVVQCFTYNACCIPQVLCIQKKRNQWDLFRVTFPFKHVVGGRETHKIVGVEFWVLPSQLPTSFPTLFSPNFVGVGKIQCLDQLQRWDVHLSKHQWMISNGWNFGHKIMSNRIPQSALREKISDSQTFSHVKQTKRSDVSGALQFLFWSLWRNDDVTRQ